VNTLVLRTDVSGQPTFSELVRRVRDVCLGAYAHRELPFESLVQALSPERSLARSPLFQVMFVFQPEARQYAMPGLEVREFQPDPGAARFDITCSMGLADGQLQGVIDYSDDLFDHETVARLADSYLTLLTSLARDPGQPIGAAKLAGQAERQRVLA